ncbi:MAG: iron-containing alcohol dehydrogenase [Bacilli bacterium]|nr:iron-containing alcohol dehydrogenase [Bacilli bacterium]
MDNFIYYTPTKIYFGKGEENKVGKILKSYNPKKILLVYGSGSVIKSGLLAKVEKLLDEEGLKYIEFGGAKPNPELSHAYLGIELGKKEGVDFVLAIGGGSAIDTAKGIANGLANPEDDLWDYHIKKKTPAKTMKKGAILTLSAAGSEMSNSSVLTNTETHVKSGYNSDFNRLDFAICNPELTYTVSPYQTACGAVDIGMHTIERYFALGDDVDITEGIAEAIIKTSIKYGKLSYLNPTDYNARAHMMWASSVSHNGLTDCGRSFLLTVHQLEHALSAIYPHVAHGAGLAALWCSWARYVYKANIDRWCKYAHNVWGIEVDPNNKEKAINEAIDKQEAFYKEINMPIGLKELGVKEEDLVSLALKTSQNKTRIIPGYKPLGYEEVLDIFTLAYNND